MTFNNDADIKGGRVSKRGRNTAIGIGGGGVGLIAVVLIGQLLGVDLTGLLGGTSGGTSGATDTPLSQCTTGSQANSDIDCRMQAAATSLDSYWSGTMKSYTQPQLVIFDQATDTGCGSATTAVGPFYCPNDQTVYIDTAFYGELKSQFGATGGPLAQLYVIAHEWGHHIQNISGIMSNSLNLQETGPTSDSVRLELQADCFAGSWVGAAQSTKDANGVPFLQPVTQAEITDALNAAAAVGDDNIQQTTQGQVDPESFTHGTSAQREKWFTAGLNGGPQACDTFGASAATL
ncbi:MAG TPA: neutral zinc metallopeptidase [Pseudolysinimonas sp.]|nr:neutral zinc metallopeptidase [Pseudolysinimonas sp.]